ncbi:MAG: GIN domain-containing protein [Pseudonocardiaceae bacterium]
MLTAPGGGMKRSVVAVLRVITILAAFGLLAGCLGPWASEGGTGSSTGGSDGLVMTNGATSGSGDSVGSNGTDGNGADGAPGADGTAGADGADGSPGADGSSNSGSGNVTSGVVTGSAHTASQVIPLSGVTSIVAGANFVVHVTEGSPEQATVRVNDNLVDLVDASVTGNQLRLGLKPGATVSNATLSAEVTVAHLDSLDASGASQVTGTIDTDHLTATGSGASTLTLSGRVQDLQLSGSGASHWLLSDLTVRDLNATLSGASNATVTVNGTLAGQADGASMLRYRGTPTITRQETSGVAVIAPDSP